MTDLAFLGCSGLTMFSSNLPAGGRGLVAGAGSAGLSGGRVIVLAAVTSGAALVMGGTVAVLGCSVKGSLVLGTTIFFDVPGALVGAAGEASLAAAAAAAFCLASSSRRLRSSSARAGASAAPFCRPSAK